MDYQKIYDSLIQKARSENRLKGRGVYYESHHIVPKCIGGDNSASNKILLTGREHFVCHKLLTKIYPKNKSLGLAFHSMVCTMNGIRAVKLSSRDFEAARLFAQQAGAGENNPRFGKKNSAHTLAKLREANLGNKFNVGRICSQETKNNISAANKGRLLGVKKSQQMRDRLSATNKGKKKPWAGKEVPAKWKPISAVKNKETFRFKSVKEMAKTEGLTPSIVSARLTGLVKSPIKGWSEFKYV